MSEIEEKAKQQGWNPDFKGENAKTAEQFIEDGEKIASIASANNKKLEEKVDILTASNTELQNNLTEFVLSQHKVVHEARKEEYKKAVKEIKAEQREAVKEGDTEKFDELEKSKNKLVKPEPVKAPIKKRPTVTPEMQQWYKDNPWFKLTPDGKPVDAISMAAVNYDIFLNDTRKDLDGIALFKEIEKNIKTVFPDSFKEATSKIETGHQENNTTGGKAYKDLPAEAKKACDAQCKKLGIDKKEWASNYWEAE